MIRLEDLILLRRLAELAGEGRTAVLATVVRTRGSTPRKVGAKLLWEPSAGVVGTVGGGCGEAEVLEAARRVLEDGRPERVTVDLTRDLLSWSPAVCGGVMEVYVERVEANPGAGDGPPAADP